MIREKNNSMRLFLNFLGDRNMKSFVVPSVALAALTVGAVALAAEIKSGLQVGESPGAYNVKDCTGPSAGRTLCYR